MQKRTKAQKFTPKPFKILKLALKNTMSKYGIIGLIAIVMAVAGIIIQVTYDERGFYLTIAGLLLSIGRQAIKPKGRRR